MVRYRSGFRAIANTPRLKHVIEGQLVGDSLSADPKRPRRENVDLRLSESRRSAGVVDQGRPTSIRQDLARAGVSAMFVLRQGQDIRDALAHRRLSPRDTADLPHARRNLRKYRLRIRGKSRGRQCSCKSKNGQASHQLLFSTPRLTGGDQMCPIRHSGAELLRLDREAR